MENTHQNEKNHATVSTGNDVNREHKSRLFTFIFGKEEHKSWTLSLYNALGGTNHTNPEDIQITTIEDTIYMGMKNDLSYMVSDRLSLYSTLNVNEQQSTYNPNMPLRELMYSAHLYDKYIKMNHFNQYSTTLIPLPIPKLVVFYNGKAEKEDEIILRLSDAFRKEIRQNVIRQYDKSAYTNDEPIDHEVDRLFEEAGPDIEVTVRMLNINYGHNKELLEACKPLSEYAWFVEEIRKNNEMMELSSAVDQALDDMPKDFQMKSLIIAHRAEVKGMCINEYNEKETMEMFRAEGEQRLALLIHHLIQDNLIDVISQVTTNVAYREELYKKYGI